jgi:acetyltransferase-like isoleucine patch superfamily enzyme
MITEGTTQPANAAGTRRERLFRTAESVLGVLPPFTGARLRTRLLRACGLRIGKSSAFWSQPTFSGPLSPLDAFAIGEAVGVNAGCHFELFAPIRLEDDVSVGHDVLFLTRDYLHADGAVSETTRPITVQRGAWIGARATILPGVTIGEGAVIGAQVVVKQDVPAHTMMTGNRQLSLAKWR